MIFAVADDSHSSGTLATGIARGSVSTSGIYSYLRPLHSLTNLEYRHYD